ncbi:MAG: hypothetical protein K6U80_05485 [Firmicutes bacterium]|nr:hypothetical protein [Bacillota bacterium]
MIKDKILIGSMAGMIATLAKDLPNLFFYKLGLVNYLYSHLAASAHLAGKDIYTPVGYILGILADIITGGAIGVVAILFLARFGTDLWWYKGIIIGNIIWLFGLGVILNLGTIHLQSLEPSFRFSAWLDHQAFGLVCVYLIRWWYKKTLQ